MMMVTQEDDNTVASIEVTNKAALADLRTLIDQLQSEFTLDPRIQDGVIRVLRQEAEQGTTESQSVAGTEDATRTRKRDQQESEPETPQEDTETANKASLTANKSPTQVERAQILCAHMDPGTGYSSRELAAIAFDLPEDEVTHNETTRLSILKGEMEEMYTEPDPDDGRRKLYFLKGGSDGEDSPSTSPDADSDDSTTEISTESEAEMETVQQDGEDDEDESTEYGPANIGQLMAIGTFDEYECHCGETFESEGEAETHADEHNHPLGWRARYLICETQELNPMRVA